MNTVLNLFRKLDFRPTQQSSIQIEPLIAVRQHLFTDNIAVDIFIIKNRVEELGAEMSPSGVCIGTLALQTSRVSVAFHPCGGFLFLHGEAHRIGHDERGACQLQNEYILKLIKMK